MSEAEEMDATAEFHKYRHRLTSFWQFFRSGIEYGQKLQKEKDAKICEKLGESDYIGNYHQERICHDCAEAIRKPR